jgi:molecular chaperone DnaK
MKLGEALYRTQQAPGDAGAPPPGGDAGGPHQPGHDDKVVDADFEEVDEPKKRGSG